MANNQPLGWMGDYLNVLTFFTILALLAALLFHRENASEHSKGIHISSGLLKLAAPVDSSKINRSKKGDLPPGVHR